MQRGAASPPGFPGPASEPAVNSSGSENRTVGTSSVIGQSDHGSDRDSDPGVRDSERCDRVLQSFSN
eukprot:700877-Hanusia_phi.AAC.1